MVSCQVLVTMLPQALRHRVPRIWTLQVQQQVQGRLMALMVTVLILLLASLERLFSHYHLLHLHQVRLHSHLLLQLLLSREEGAHPLHAVVLLAEEEAPLLAGVWPVLPGVARQRAEAEAVTDACVCLQVLGTLQTLASLLLFFINFDVDLVS